MIRIRLGQRITHAVLAAFLACGTAGHAARAGQTWTIASDHPADTAAGRGVQSFVAALTRQTDGVLTGRAEFMAKAATKDPVAAVLDGNVQAVDVFAGALAHVDPIFELSTLPFAVRSEEESRRLACLAKPAYRRALLRAGLHLLFISPWPPTGLWSRQPVTTLADLANLRVRTYDDASAEVLGALGAHGAALPVQDVGSLLRNGRLDAVLSSGDGAVGITLQANLSNFNAIHYAFPVSFVVMSQSRYEALPEKLRPKLDAAANEVESQQWTSLPARIRANDVQMQHAGVRVNTSIDNALDVRLREAGQARVYDWLSRVPPEDADIIRTFQHQEAPAAQVPCPLSLLEAGRGTRE
ncbi:TRAP transporter substrate-binding protein DctP [Paraburkholderia sp. MM6662-R1]|uniref:TRAP transporter substrate-binding protein DctP n=1 Tax=Paraburkholderia sp. MM6662-R1 TaxID=2991066 RepID=UPI003D1EE290